MEMFATATTGHGRREQPLSRTRRRRGTPGRAPRKGLIPISILGVPIVPVTLPEALARIGAMVAEGGPHQVVTANVDFLVQARADEELRRIFIEASLVLCDGTPVLWASRFLGNPLPERVAGSDLAPRLIEAAEQRGWRLFLLGGAPEVAATAVASLREKHPRLRIAGHYSPPFQPLETMDHDDMIARIRRARPDILLVSFGCPKAEKWIARHAAQLGVPVMIGVGATIDFLAGRVARAPVWMQRSGTEWLFRIGQEPRRLAGRYLRDLWQFGRALAGQWWRLHPIPVKSADPASARARLKHGENRSRLIEMPPVLDAASVNRDHAVWAQAASGSAVLDLGAVQFIDSTGVGLLLWLRRKIREAGRTLILANVSEVVARALHQLRLEPFFRLAGDSAEASRRLEPRGAATAARRAGAPSARRVPVARSVRAAGAAP